MKYLRESLGPLCFVSALCGAYMLFYIHLTDMLDATAPMVRSFGDALVASWVVLLAFVVATVTYAAKASTGKAPWSLVAGTTLGVAYLLMSVWMATVASVAGADSVEGMIAVAGAGIAILGGVALTSACALMFADRLRKRAQSRSSASFAQGIYPVR